MATLNLIGWLAVRVTIGYVYLFALYMNTRDSAARKWTLDHTAYMFPKLREPNRTRIALLFAVAGMAMMGLGGVSILLGLEGRIGAFLLLIFTAGGIYSHKCEREVAMAVSAKIEPSIPPEIKPDFMTIQWSAFSGHFSSGLKNWALCGVCMAVIAWGTGPLSLSDRIFDCLQLH
jgi:uncharacterized membrane protein YphA (DoxX/SURF4 family)